MAAGIFAASMSGATMGVANANVGDSLPDECLQFSQDDGASWDAPGPKFNSITPVPGGESLWAEFQNRNNCDVPAKLVYVSENWEVGKNASATLRVNLDGVDGQQVVIGPDNTEKYIVLNESDTLETDQAVTVEWLLGIPAEETVQGFNISPGMGIDLIQSAPLAPTALEVTPVSPTTANVMTASGSAEPNVTVAVLVDGVEKCSATTDEAGIFTCEIGALAPGTYDVSAVATDKGVASEPTDIVEVTVSAEQDPETGPGSLGSLGSSGILGSSAGFGSLIEVGSPS